MIGFLLMATVYVMALTGRIHAPVRARADVPAISRAFVRALPALLAPVLLVGGILGGVATPTELGAMTVIYATVLGFINRELAWRDVWRCFSETLVTCGVLVFIISAAVPFGWVIAVENIPTALAALMLSWTDSPYAILALINLLRWWSAASSRPPRSC